MRPAPPDDPDKDSIGLLRLNRVVGIEDVTPLAAQIHGLVREGELERAGGMLPDERPLPLDADVPAHLWSPE